jgi:hypothetical protein
MSGVFTQFTPSGELISRCGLVKMTDQSPGYSGTCLIFYRNGTDYHGKCRVVAYSGLSTIVGDEYKFNAASTRSLSADRMDDTHLGVLYVDEADLKSRLVYATVSGLSVQFGLPVVVDTHNTSDVYWTDLPIVGLSSSKVSFVTSTLGSGVMKRWNIYNASLSGTSFVVGPVRTNFTNVWHVYRQVGLAKLDSDRVILGLYDGIGTPATKAPIYLFNTSGLTPSVLSSGTFSPGTIGRATDYNGGPQIQTLDSSGFMLNWMDSSSRYQISQAQTACMRMVHVSSDNSLVVGKYLYPPPRAMDWYNNGGLYTLQLKEDLGVQVWSQYDGCMNPLSAWGLGLLAMRLNPDDTVSWSGPSYFPGGGLVLGAAALSEYEVLCHEVQTANSRFTIYKLSDQNFIGDRDWTQLIETVTPIWTSGTKTFTGPILSPVIPNLVLPGLNADSNLIWFKYYIGTSNFEYISAARLSNSGILTASNQAVYPTCSGDQHALLTFWTRRPFDNMVFNVERGWDITLGSGQVVLNR